MALFAEVAVEGTRALEHPTYTYSVPVAMDLVPGHRVLVPFGRREVRGYVVELHTEVPEIEIRPVLRPDPPDPLLLPHQVELARLVSDHYWAPLMDCLMAMVPPRIRRGRSTGAGASPRQTRHSRLLAIARAPGRDLPPELNAEQLAAVAAIARNSATLLHGVTGSGKTEVYLAAAQEALAGGLRVLVLVPEITLTPQLVGRFRRRLGVPMAILHSQLTDLERAQEWWRVRRGEVELVIGSRSAAFAPLARLGLVCVDEEGSSAYKQDRVPRYDASWVARHLATITGARLVLGSATPTVATFSQTETGALALARLSRRARGRDPEVELVDMRQEFLSGHRLALSRRLLEVVDRSLEAGEQAILFLNRRGMATMVLCRECGQTVQCPDCSVAMVQHPELDGLACHYCARTAPLPALCPQCGSRQIKALGIGTQRLESLVRRIWPAARVVRLDSDTARAGGGEGYLALYEKFAAGEADILVGTQLAARGLDLEAVSAVGVVDADLPLHFPDYRSAEMTFALVTQVAGRAGRGARPARVVVQTSNPDHYSLRRAATGDYDGFYGDELPSRSAFRFPPYADLIVLTCAHEEDAVAGAAAREAAEAMAAAIAGRGFERVRLLGPSPAFIHKLRGQYRWQITLKGDGLARMRPYAPRGRGWTIDVDPVA